MAHCICPVMKLPGSTLIPCRIQTQPMSASRTPSIRAMSFMGSTGDEELVTHYLIALACTCLKASSVDDANDPTPVANEAAGLQGTRGDRDAGAADPKHGREILVFEGKRFGVAHAVVRHE